MTRTPTLRALAPEHVVIHNHFIDPDLLDSLRPHVVFVAERNGNEVDSIRMPVPSSLRDYLLYDGITQWGADLCVSRNEKILVAVEVNDDYEGYSIPSGTSIPAGTTIGLEESGGYRLATLRPDLLARGWARRW